MHFPLWYRYPITSPVIRKGLRYFHIQPAQAVDDVFEGRKIDQGVIIGIDTEIMLESLVQHLISPKCPGSINAPWSIIRDTDPHITREGSDIYVPKVRIHRDQDDGIGAEICRARPAVSSQQQHVNLPERLVDGRLFG